MKQQSEPLRATYANYDQSFKYGASNENVQIMGILRSANIGGEEVYVYNAENKDIIIKHLREELKERDDEIGHLRTRLSQVSSEKIRQGNPNIADLSDTHRPMKLIELYYDLYSKEWTKAFEEMSLNGTGEKQTIKSLLRIIKHSYKFCMKISTEQLQAMKKSFAKDIIFPLADHAELKAAIPESNKELKEIFSVLTESRKRVGALSLPKIKQAFVQMVKMDLKIPIKEQSSLKLYVNRCVELCWFMCLQDPPMYVEWCVSGDHNTGDFSSYTRSGTTVNFCVWPCVRQYENGPLMAKGVAQMR
ncbi:hypothetical protein ACJMK2_031161 [Sinanodonta woodiana]|uniref:Mitochondria-eating protein C-terminal domain-containing protein n=1 Tax=Sinanodonta woodiana TaxID=1069815 RepID=A0ABD3X1Y0_SINWO